MPRPARGSVVTHKGADGRFYRSLRFTAYGKRERVPLGVVSADEADAKLRQTLADVERGIWKRAEAPAPPPPEPVSGRTFHEWAEEWWTLTEPRLAERTRTDYRWRLERHLIPYFGPMRLDAIDFGTVEAFLAAKQAENARIRERADTDDPITERVTDKRGRVVTRKVRPLGPRSLNMMTVLLGAILERARKRKLIVENAAKDPDLRLREPAPGRSYLETAAQIAALLHAAGELDKEAAEHRHVERRAIIATLVFSGLRVGELCELRWCDVDLATGWLSVGRSKTDAGVRRVKLRGALRDELAAVRGRCPNAPQAAYVFATAKGGKPSADNLRARVLAPAVARATANLEAAGHAPLPQVTPHGLRRTFASLLYALGEPSTVVMAEMGHTDPGLALRIYAAAMRRGEGEQAELGALVEGGVLANSGQRSPIEAPAAKLRRAA